MCMYHTLGRVDIEIFPCVCPIIGKLFIYETTALHSFNASTFMAGILKHFKPHGRSDTVHCVKKF